jgi:hypothetical protein
VGREIFLLRVSELQKLLQCNNLASKTDGAIQTIIYVSHKERLKISLRNNVVSASNHQAMKMYRVRGGKAPLILYMKPR